ncbi:MAG TPA: HEAT repeat domain-containing protein [Blastocatellia bacterium]|nr:HEAT repeat domain-containing protein [Blastocatellia bacterium]
MKKILYTIALLFVVSLTVADHTYAQRGNFTPVDGASLRGKLDNAISRGRAAQSRFWAGYQFDVRPGVCVDLEFNNDHGGKTIVNGIVYQKGQRIETRNLGVFMQYDAAGTTLERVELYNLDREHSFSGYPVYWMGRATADESLALLRGIVDGNNSTKTAENAVISIAMHDDARIEGIIEGFARNSTNNKVRQSAVFWMGQLPGSHPYLGEVVRNEQENTELRKQAAFSLGISSDPQAMTTLQSIYGTINNHEVKKQIIFAAFVNKDRDGDDDQKRSGSDEGTNFLIRVAESDRDNDLKKQALFWVGQRAGQRSLDVLGKTVESEDADTDVQKQAVFAISQRPRDEAVPLLIKIAKTHAKPEVRKQAMFWLGQTGDPRALEFFKEVLSK